MPCVRLPPTCFLPPYLLAYLPAFSLSPFNVDPNFSWQAMLLKMIRQGQQALGKHLVIRRAGEQAGKQDAGRRLEASKRQARSK